jgi:hypothetical protein
VESKAFPGATAREGDFMGRFGQMLEKSTLSPASIYYIPMSNPHGPIAPTAPPAANFMDAMSRQFAVFAYTRRAVALVWDTNRRLAIILALLTLAAGLLPAAMAWVGKLIVDGVVLQMDAVRSGGTPDYWLVLKLLLLEADSA